MSLSHLNEQHLESFLNGYNTDPFALLGMHETHAGIVVSTFQPDAIAVALIYKENQQVIAHLEQYQSSGFFSVLLTNSTSPFAYQLQIIWPENQQLIDDPYQFGLLLSDFDSHLLIHGQHLRAYQQLGAHFITLDDTRGVRFTVWAPHAKRVSVIGDFNFWDGRRHPMRFRPESGIWELFIPHVNIQQCYKFELIDYDGNLRYKSDPYAFSSQRPPEISSHLWHEPIPQKPNTCHSIAAIHQPITIYEVHLGSWRRHDDGSWLTYWQLADQLIPYVKSLGFTHIELLPINEHPFDGSWGYQPLGLYAPTQRFGSPDGLHYFIEKAHQENIKVLLDWVPAHFPQDESGLVYFDGRPLYEYADPKEGKHQDWQTLIYNFRRDEVRNFLQSNALYWLECFQFDGLRVDAVTSMLYRDYSRQHNEWIPNEYGGKENLEAISFLKAVNQTIQRERPDCLMIAEESTNFSGVTKPVDQEGLGFHFKWNMGWMHDTLRYLQSDPLYRYHLHNLMTFGLLYAHQENYVLPLSHDEVVHGKGSLLNKMFGTMTQKFASLRAYYGFMWAYPGKKLLFMGGEFGQWQEWNHDSQLEWYLLEGEHRHYHQGVQHLIRDLNYCYLNNPALYQCDQEQQGFSWLVVDDRENSVFAFLRRDKFGREVIVISHFMPKACHHYQIGVPQAGKYIEILNTDSTYYGGNNQGNDGSTYTTAMANHGHQHTLTLYLPPLTTLYLTLESDDE